MKKKYFGILLLIMIFIMLPGTKAIVSAAPDYKITSKLDLSASDSQDCTNTTKHIPHTHEDSRKCWEWDKDETGCRATEYSYPGSALY